MINLYIMIDTTDAVVYYSISYLSAISLCAGLVFYAGLKNGYPKIPWLLIIMTGGLFFILGEKLASYTPGDWAEFFSGFRLPATGKKTILGGIVGVFAGLVLARTWFRFHRPVLDPFAIALPVCMAVSRLGCLKAGCCFGTTTSLPWAIHYGPSSLVFQTQMMHSLVNFQNGSSAGVHPIQIYEFLGCLMIAFLVWRTRKRWTAGGNLFLFSLLCYAVLRFGIEFIRAPESSFIMVRSYLGLKFIQWVILGVSVAGVTMLVVRESVSRSGVKIIPQNHVTKFRQMLLLAFLSFIAISGRKWFTIIEMSLIVLFLVPVSLVMFGNFIQWIVRILRQRSISVEDRGRLTT